MISELKQVVFFLPVFLLFMLRKQIQKLSKSNFLEKKLIILVIEIFHDEYRCIRYNVD